MSYVLSKCLSLGLASPLGQNVYLTGHRPVLVRKEREEGIVASAVGLLLHVLIASFQDFLTLSLSSGHVVV